MGTKTVIKSNNYSLRYHTLIHISCLISLLLIWCRYMGQQIINKRLSQYRNWSGQFQSIFSMAHLLSCVIVEWLPDHFCFIVMSVFFLVINCTILICMNYDDSAISPILLQFYIIRFSREILYLHSEF